MPALPPASDITGSSRTEGQAKTWFTDMRGYLASLLGTLGTVKDARDTFGSSLQASLVDLFRIDIDTGHRDLIASGWRPAFFNQQWGGAPHYFELVDSATGVPYKFEAATGYTEQSGITDMASVAGVTWTGQGFKVSKDVSVPAVWIKIGKVGNPTNNLECRILPDDGTGTKPTGSTPITNGTATAQSGRLHSSDSGAFGTQWVRFVFPTPPALTANLFYHITFKSSGAVDSVNYWTAAYTSALKPATYPHGNLCTGDGTPTWGASSAADLVFLVEQSSSLASLQSGGIFSDGKLVFFEGSPLNQSNGRVKNLKDFQGLDLTDFTLLVRGTAWTKDKTILDITYGLDSDRIVLRSNVTTGFAQVDVYESDSTRHTVTATSVDLSSGDHDVAIRVRAKNDGSDRVDLYVDGAANGTPVTNASIAFDTLFGLAQIGTFWLGGGFAIAPTWTQKLAMGVLPSADSPAWTWFGTGTESACMSVSGGKLYQNKNGYTSSQVGYYERSSLALSNSNGWALASKVRVPSSTNTKGVINSWMRAADGTKVADYVFHEYFIQSLQLTTDHYLQHDLKLVENTVLMIGKGSDVFYFLNGRLILDGHGLMTSASASNLVNFGDGTSAPNENADVVRDYVAFYNTAWLPPQFTSGSLSELAIWNGDRTSALSMLYNSGVRIGVKEFCGVEKNYVGDEVVQRVTQSEITPSPTTTSTSLVIAPEMECFVVGADIDMKTSALLNNAIDLGNTYISVFLDGGIPVKNIGGDGDLRGGTASGAGGQLSGGVSRRKRTFFGLHKVEQRWAVSTSTGISFRRILNVEART